MHSFSITNPYLKYENLVYGSVKNNNIKQNTYTTKEGSKDYMQITPTPRFPLRPFMQDKITLKICKINLVSYFKFRFKVYHDLFTLYII